MVADSARKLPPRRRHIRSGPCARLAVYVGTRPAAHFQRRQMDHLRRRGHGLSLRHLCRAGRPSHPATRADRARPFETWHAGVSRLGRIPLLDPAAGGRLLRSVGRLFRRPLRTPPHSHLEHSPLRFFGHGLGTRHTSRDPAPVSARFRSPAPVSSSSRPWRGSPKYFPIHGHAKPCSATRRHFPRSVAFSPPARSMLPIAGVRRCPSSRVPRRVALCVDRWSSSRHSARHHPSISARIAAVGSTSAFWAR